LITPYYNNKRVCFYVVLIAIIVNALSLIGRVWRVSDVAMMDLASWWSWRGYGDLLTCV